jgi:hypothetical protein
MLNQSMKNPEQGSVIIVALVMLVLLTIIGMSASTTSEIEMLIAGNERVYKQNFYRAEATAMEAVQLMENDPGDPKDLGWVLDEADLPDTMSNFVTNLESTLTFSGVTAHSSPALSNAEFLSLSYGVVAGGSLDMSKSKVYEYSVYGRSDQNRGLGMVKLGYRKAF